MKTSEEFIKIIGDLKVEVMKTKEELQDTLYHTNALADVIFKGKFKGINEVKVWTKWVEFRNKHRIGNRINE